VIAALTEPGTPASMAARRAQAQNLVAGEDLP